MEQLDALFADRGPPAELLMDNSTVFRSRLFAQFTARWGITMRYRCAYVPSGNGIVERNHRTVKVIAARKGCAISEAVDIYNATPRDIADPESKPACILNGYKQTDMMVLSQMVPDQADTVESRYEVGECVWVRPPQVRCDMQYEQGVVTNVISEQAVEVDGVPRHIRELRPRVAEEDSDSFPQNMERHDLQGPQSEFADAEPLILRFGTSGRAEDRPVTGPAGDDMSSGRPLRRSERLRRQPDRLCYV